MQVNFGRAIRIATVYSNNIPKKERKYFPMKETVSLLETEQPSIYDKETSEKIKGFLQSQFKDYNKKTGLEFREHNSSLYAITGKEAQMINSKKYMHRNTIGSVLENGKGKKPKSSITFNVNKEGELKSITYYSTQKTKDGCNAACEILQLE